LAEFGLIEAQGLHKVSRLIAIVMDEKDGRVPDIARQVLKVIVNQIEDTQIRIASFTFSLLGPEQTARAAPVGTRRCRPLLLPR
jgi:transposase